MEPRTEGIMLDGLPARLAPPVCSSAKLASLEFLPRRDLGRRPPLTSAPTSREPHDSRPRLATLGEAKYSFLLEAAASCIAGGGEALGTSFWR